MTEYERLHVQLIPKAAEALGTAMTSEGLSKTDVANRAIQLYAFIRARLAAGDELLIRHADGTTDLVHLI